MTSLPTIPRETYEQLVHYFKYASSAYAPLCLRPNGNHLVSHFESAVSGPGVAGFVARDDKRQELIVAIRGSASLTDVLLDSQLELVPFVCPGIFASSNVRVHCGFLLAWNTVSLQVIGIVVEQMHLSPEYNIVVAGHSLGGSLAILGAMCLKKTLPSMIVKCYSYGAPRTGNDDFAKMVDDMLGGHAFRVVHSNDGVATIIPTSLGYHHHGTEYWQKCDPPSEDTTFQCSKDGEDPRCSMSVLSGGINAAHMKYFGIIATTPFCL